MHPAQLAIDQLLADCSVRTLRRGGPGGQHRNKVETAVVIEHRPTGLRAEANERRSQADNQRMAITRLRLALALAHREPLAMSDGAELMASTLWAGRVVGNRINVSAEHEDFPAILSELLDLLAARDYQLAAVGELLHVTTSQLVNVLRTFPPALRHVNERREAMGLRKLQ